MEPVREHVCSVGAENDHRREPGAFAERLDVLGDDELADLRAHLRRAVGHQLLECHRLAARGLPGHFRRQSRRLRRLLHFAASLATVVLAWTRRPPDRGPRTRSEHAAARAGFIPAIAGSLVPTSGRSSSTPVHPRFCGVSNFDPIPRGFLAAVQRGFHVSSHTLRNRAVEMMWAPERIRILDQDLGQSGAQTTTREDFKTLVADVSLGRSTSGTSSCSRTTEPMPSTCC